MGACYPCQVQIYQQYFVLLEEIVFFSILYMFAYVSP
jgi:hypothetical protein